jgi:hypothetical protein
MTKRRSRRVRYRIRDIEKDRPSDLGEMKLEG